MAMEGDPQPCLGRQRSFAERQRWCCCGLDLSFRGGQSMQVCALQKELDLVCVWWTAAMMIALTETGATSAVKNQSLAFL